MIYSVVYIKSTRFQELRVKSFHSGSATTAGIGAPAGANSKSSKLLLFISFYSAWVKTLFFVSKTNLIPSNKNLNRTYYYAFIDFQYCEDS